MSVLHFKTIYLPIDLYLLRFLAKGSETSLVLTFWLNMQNKNDKLKLKEQEICNRWILNGAEKDAGGSTLFFNYHQV